LVASIFRSSASAAAPFRRRAGPLTVARALVLDPLALEELVGLGLLDRELGADGLLIDM
jgi:hypothetical protein